MNKKLIQFPIIAALSFGIVGCGMNDKSALQNRDRNMTQPVGYYSNENHAQNRGGNARILDGTDNDGPATELMDYSFGLEGENYRNNQRKRPVRNNARNSAQLFSREDMNYHGHLGDNLRKVESYYYYEAYEGHLVEKINETVAKINNVQDVQTVIHGNNAIIAVNLASTNHVNETKAEIRRAIRPLLQGKTSRIVTDASTFSRLRNIDNGLRDWGPKDQIYLDLNNLFRTNNNR